MSNAKRERSRAWREKNRDRINTYMREYRTRNLETIRRVERQSMLRRRYGLSIEKYDEMCAARGGKCDLCRELPRGRGYQGGRLVVDHDHDTGHVRGLLCFHCNTAIGKLRDDPALCEEAAAYLRRTKFHHKEVS